MNALMESFNLEKLIFREKHYKRNELLEAIDDLSDKLKSGVVSQSPFILLTAYNHIKTLIAFFAIVKSGKKAVIINPETKSIELSEIIDETDPAAIILLDSTKNELDFENEVIFRTESIDFSKDKRLEDVVLLMYTNAEDGKSKAAMITEENILSSIAMYADFENINEKNVICAILPFYHVLGFIYGMLMPCFKKCTLYISEMNLIRIHNLVKDISSANVNYIFSVPSVYFLFSKIPGIRDLFKKTPDFITGGIKLSPEIVERFQKATGKQIREGYGLTEASPGVSLTPRGNTYNPDSIGEVFPGCEVMVVDKDNNTCAANHAGEIYIKGKNVFKGYFNHTNKNRKKNKTNWVATGDYGMLDSNNNLYFKGLKKNMYNVAGHNVYPKELERMLYLYPQVRFAKLYNEKTLMQGDLIQAQIELIDPSENEINNFKIWCADNITNYKLPRVWEFLK